MKNYKFRLVYKYQDKILFVFISLGSPCLQKIDKYQLIDIDRFLGKDKSNNDIYVNDIIKVPCGYSGDYRVKEYITLLEEDTDYYVYMDFPDNIDLQDCEKISDIHTNPTIFDYQEALQSLDTLYPTKEI
jgi:hypothetical protein